MKWKTLAVFVSLVSAACSSEDVQFDLEKVTSVTSETTQERPDTGKQPQTQNTVANQGFSAVALAKNTSAVQTSNTVQADGDLQNTDSTADSKTELSLNKEAPIDPELMRELEASLAKINDAELMTKYGQKGSAIDLQLGGSELSNGPVALVISNRNLVSNVTSVSGATSISGDPTGFGFTIGLSGDYLFEFDKDTLTPKAQAALKSVLTLYKDYQGTQIQIVGHTDAKGSNEYNLDLSKRRASSVKQWFETAGIDPALMTTQGYGETKPVADNTKNGKDYPEGRALNRRVEITVKTQKRVNHLPTVSKPASLP